MRKANLARVVELKCAPSNLEKALLAGMEVHPDREWWVDEYGSSVNYSLPRFYYKDGSDEQEINVSKSTNQIPRVPIGGSLVACHRLACAAFNENPDPDNLTEVDHITDPNDLVLVSQTILIFNALKWYEPSFEYGQGRRKEGNSYSLQPHMVNYMPSYLRWVTPGENRTSARSPEHKEFLKKVKEMTVGEALKYVNLDYDELNRLKDIPHTGEEMIRKAGDVQERYYEHHHEELVEHYSAEDEYMRCIELGEKEYIKKLLFEDKEATTWSLNPAIVGKDHSRLAWAGKHLIKPNGLPLGPVEKWTEGDWDDVIEFVKWANSHGVEYYGQVKFVLPLPKLKIDHPRYEIDGTLKEGVEKLNFDFGGNVFCGWGNRFVGLLCGEERKRELLERKQRESFVA